MSDVNSETLSDVVSDTVDGSEEEGEEYYSQDATVQTIRDYYAFLCTMYLDPARVAEPPEEGWPEITAERFKHMHKSEQVIELLRHLPYITTTNDDDDVAYGSAHCKFADWATEARLRRFPEQSDEKEGDDWRVCSEVYDYENVPDTVIGLTLGGRGNDTIMLDTEMGMIHWIECPGELKRSWKLYPDGRMEPYQFDEESDSDEGSNLLGGKKVKKDYRIVKSISSDIFGEQWEAENEREWRSEGGTWDILDFFEVLKSQFLRLDFVPISNCKVVDTRSGWPGNEDMLAEVRQIWREFGWPEAALVTEGEKGGFDKKACLERIKEVTKEKYNYDTTCL